jgi:SAM-dependent methyltransferase
VDERLAAHLQLMALSDEDFVSCAFLLTLRRAPDQEARASALDALRGHELSRAGLVANLIASEEFERLRALDDGIVRGNAARATGERPHELSAPADVDERPIEMAWTLGRYRGEPRVLDVGYAFAEPVWLAALLAIRPRELTGVDIAEREVPGMSTVVADVRRLPFPARSFDVVFCISTLEHVGADNTRYGAAPDHDPTGPIAALHELRRIVARGGRILVTVPSGERLQENWYVHHTAAEWRELFDAADLYVYDEEEYADHGVLCAELHPGRRRHELVHLFRRGKLRRRDSNPRWRHSPP